MMSEKKIIRLFKRKNGIYLGLFRFFMERLTEIGEINVRATQSMIAIESKMPFAYITHFYTRKILKQVQDDEAERIFFTCYHSTPNSSLREGFFSRRSNLYNKDDMIDFSATVEMSLMEKIALIQLLFYQ